jgi:hypothetical protein
MSQPPTPPRIDSLGDRPFSFYPAIVNIEHNEWRFGKTTWSEVLVTNTRTGQDLWIPRRYVGELSRIDEPVVIVGLARELEYKGGTVWPFQRRVVEMPAAVGGVLADPKSTPAVISAPSGSATDARMLRLIAAVLVIAIGAYLVMASLFHEGTLRPRLVYTTKDQSYLDLKARDDYWAVVARLGPPARDRWMPESGEIQYRALSYPNRAYTVILMGPDSKSTTYIGTLDDHWKPVHAIPFRGGGNSFALLRHLRRF